MTRLHRLLAGVTVMTGVLMVLGVYTAASGAGLTCAGRWPLCDGFLGLFPATLGSFIEWFHRLVAMLTGFVILGTTLVAWRTGTPRRIRYALALATLVLPSQIVLGALTVTEYEWIILTAHFLTASVIFTAVVAASAWAVDDRREWLGRALRVAAAGLVVLLVLTPHALVGFGPTVQAAFYVVGLATYALLVTAALWTPHLDRVRLATGVAAVGTLALLVLGRQVFGPTVQTVHVAGALAALGLVVAAIRWLDRETAATGTARTTLGNSD